MKLPLLNISWQASSSESLLGSDTIESVFGGLILLGVITLLVKGTLRLEREIEYRDKTIATQEETIREQRKTIESTMAHFSVTKDLLQDLKDNANNNGANGQ